MPERPAELLAVRAVAGLSPEEARELEDLLGQYSEIDERDYDLAIASLQLEPLPKALRERLLRQAEREPPPRPSGWFAAFARKIAGFLRHSR